MDAFNMIGNLGAAGQVLGTIGDAVFNNPVGYVAGAVALGVALAHVEPDKKLDDVDEFGQMEDVSDSKAMPPGDENEEPTPLSYEDEEPAPPSRAVKRQRTDTSSIVPSVEEPMVSYNSYVRPVATLAEATEFARPVVAPNLRPIIEQIDPEPAILEESRRLQVPLSVQAILAARASKATNEARVDKLQFEINELRAEIYEAEQLEPTFAWACKQRMLARSRSVRRVSKMRAPFNPRLM